VAWSVLQSSSAVDNTANQGSFHCTYTANLTAGSKMIAAVEISGSATAVTSTVKDGGGNSFTKIFSVNLNNTSGDGELSLWAMDTPAADVGTKPVITATFSTATEQGCVVFIQEVAGLAHGNTTAAMIDGSAATTTGATGSSTGSPSYSSTAASEYLVALYGDACNSVITWTAPAGYTTDPNSVNSTGAGDLGFAYKNSTNGSEAGSWGRTNSTSNWAAATVAFKLPAAAIGGAQPPAAPGRTWRRQFQHRQQPRVIVPPPPAFSGSSAITGTGLAAPAGSKGGTGSSAVTGTGVLTAPPPTIVQQVTGTSTYDYGLSTVELTTSVGNTLVVLAGWDLSTQATTAAMPAVNVTDDAGNYWIHVGTSPSSVTGSRCAAFVCVNALPVEWVSVSATTFVSSLAYTVLEVANMPLNYSIDVAAINSASSATTLAVSPGAASTVDIGFTVLAAGGAGVTASGPGAGWSALTGVTAGAGSPNPVQIFPYWAATSLTAGVAADISWSVGQSLPLSGVTFAITASAAPPAQPNPNFPVIKAEAAFGYTPGDPSQAPPAWTDISARIIGRDGSPFATSVMGREYELSQAEAGELHLDVNNADGAFTPGNASSEFYPDVVLGVPLRLSAWWAGRWYFAGYGYVERWPQQWPDLPQWGISRMIATDAISVAASATMASALDSDILLDAPYVFIPASEQYTTFEGGINPTFTAADAQGLLAANDSRVNPRAAFYADGVPASGTTYQAATGQATNMLGDADSGFGTSGIAAAATVSQSGPGIVYTDANMPDPLSVNGVSVEFWLLITAAAAATAVQPVVFSAYGPPSNYLTAHPGLQVQVNNFTGNHTLTVTLADGSTVSAAFSVSQLAQQVVLTITSSALNIYVNGALAATSSLTAAQATSWNAFTVGCPNYAYQAGSVQAGNFTAFDIATYPYILPVQRILSHYVTGATGQQGVDAVQRVAQILSWANLGFARGGQEFFNGVQQPVAEGPAYSLGGASATDALNQVALNEAGMVAAMPSGALVFIHKWGLFNQAPAAVLGDAPLPSAGEVPYLQPTAWDLDNTYLFNITQATQQSGPNNTITVQAVDFGSQHAYFTRSALQQTIQTTSDLDAYDSANYAIAKYSQPQLRVSGVQIDAASNPAAAFPVILALQQGQVVTVTRRPVGGAVVTGSVIIQKIQHEIGPTSWLTSLQLSPYVPEDAILQLDTPGYDVLGNMGLA
jgi:hypothetical protein